MASLQLPSNFKYGLNFAIVFALNVDGPKLFLKNKKQEVFMRRIEGVLRRAWYAQYFTSEEAYTARHL